MDDLSECLEHVGIAVMRFGWNDPAYKELFRSFRPNVLLSFDNPSALNFLDLEFIRDYKERYGLLRLLSTHHPKGIDDRISLSASDEWRLDLLTRGLTADAFFCLMDEGYFDIFLRHWHSTGIKYLSLPMAANPLWHRPRAVAKDLDWAIATNNCDWGVRAELTERYMWKLLTQYRGIIVGADWDPGIALIPHREVPELLARARICPSPRIDLSVRFPTEIGGKTFEIPAMGGFILVSRTAALHKFFGPSEIAAVDGPKDFIEKFEFFLHQPEKRYEMVSRAMERVFACHTYFHRIDKLVGFVTNLMN